MTFHSVERLPEFEKDLKKLKKKYKSLEDDLDMFIKAQLTLYHKQGLDNGGIVRIPGLGFETPKVFKARKFACKYLKGTGSNSGIRVIYAYFEVEDKIELVEIYYKGNKENEDRNRVDCNYGDSQK